MYQGRVGGRGGIDVGINQDLFVCAVDRVVQHGVVQANLDARQRMERAVEDEDVADLGDDRVINAFIEAALCYGGSIRVAEQDADADASPSAVGERTERPGVFRQEQP